MATVEELAVQIAAINRASGEIRKIAADITRLDATAGSTRGFSAFNRIGAKFSNILSAVGLETTAVGSSFTRTQSAMRGFGASLVAVSASAAAVGAAIAITTKSAIGFESQIVKVAKTAGFSADETKQFSEEILNLARRLPLSISGLTSVAAVAGQLGIVGPKNIALFTEEIAKLSSTTGVAAEDLATSIGTIIQVSGIPIKNVSNLSAAITELGNTSNSTEAQILEFMTRLVGVSKAVGVPVAALAGISSSFAAAGVDAERGATAIQKILIAISESAQNGGKELETFARVTGHTADEFRELARTNAAEAFTQFIEGLRGVENVTQVLEALGIADSRLVAAALSVANSTESVRKSIDTATGAAIRATATNEEFARSSQTTSARLQLLRNNISALSISMGQEFLPAVNNVAAGLIVVTDAMRDIGPVASEIVEDLGRAADVSFDGLVVAVEGIASALKDVNAALDSVNAKIPLLVGAGIALATAFAIFAPGGALIIGVGLLAVGIGVLTAKIDESSTAALKFRLLFIDAIVEILEAIKAVADTLEPLDNVLPGDPFANIRARARETRNDVFLLGEEIRGVIGLRGAANAFVESAKLDPRFGLPEGDPRRVQAELQLINSLKQRFGVDITGQSGGGGGGPSVPTPSTTIPVPDVGGLTQGVSRLQQVLQAASDGVVTLSEAIQLGLSDTQVVALELASAENEVANKRYRERIELLKLAALFPGLTGAEVQFRIALGQIAEHLRETGQTIEQFILDTSTSALEGFKSAFDAIFSRPTKETAQLELQLATLERDRLLRKQAGASDEELKGLDSRIDAIRLQLDIRRKEIEIIKAKNTLADQTLLTDAALATQAALLTEAIKITSAQVSEVGGIVYLQLTNLGNAANDAAAALRGITPQGFASGGFARGLAVVGERGPELADFGNGARIYSNRDSQALLNGSSGGSFTANIYVTADSAASDATARKIAGMVRDEVNFLIRRQNLGGSNFNQNAFTPAGGAR